MSFGWSAGDIITAIKLLVEITQALNSASGSPVDHKRAAAFINPITHSLQALHSYILIEEESLISPSDPKISGFRPTIEALEPLVKEFTDKVLEYSGLSEEGRKRDWVQKQFGKLKWHFVEKEELGRVRGLIEGHFALLGALFPGMIINVLEFQELKSAERDADILDVVNKNSRGIGDIYELVSRIWEVQMRSSGMLAIGPEAGVEKDILLAGGEQDPEKSMESGFASALLLVEPHVRQPMTEEFATQATKMKVDGAVVRKLRSWLSEPSLSRLWLFGTKSTTLSAIVFNTARKRNRAVVAYPCRHTNRAETPNTEEEILVGLVYSFIYQLLQQLPTGTVLDGWTEKKRFDELDGTFDSFVECLQLIRSLLKVVKGCCCIIDGFQTLGHTQSPQIQERLEDLLKVFEGEEDCRLLLTSSGPSPILAGFDKGVVDRLDISRLVDSGRFVLSVELMSVQW